MYLRTVEASTMPVLLIGWIGVVIGWDKGFNVLADKYMPYFIMVQWYLIPWNVLLFGWWTIVMFPVTIGFTGFTYIIYKPYVEPWLQQAKAENDAKYE